MRKLLAALLAVLLVLPLTVLGHAAAAEDEHVSVIIGLSDAGGRSAIALAKGKIEREFDFINAVQVKLPKRAVERLARALGIEYVEPDCEARACRPFRGEWKGWAPQVPAPDTRATPSRSPSSTPVFASSSRPHGTAVTMPPVLGSHNDDNGHGTRGGNGRPWTTLSACWAWRRRCACSRKGSGPQRKRHVRDIIAGIQWAINNMDIINMPGAAMAPPPYRTPAMGV